MGNRQSSIVNGCCRATDGQRLGLRLFEAIFIKMKRGLVRSFRKKWTTLPYAFIQPSVTNIPKVKASVSSCRRHSRRRCVSRSCACVGLVLLGASVCVRMDFMDVFWCVLCSCVCMCQCLCVPVSLCFCVPVLLCSVSCLRCPVFCVPCSVFCVMCCQVFVECFGCGVGCSQILHVVCVIQCPLSFVLCPISFVLFLCSVSCDMCPVLTNTSVDIVSMQCHVKQLCSLNLTHTLRQVRVLYVCVFPCFLCRVSLYHSTTAVQHHSTTSTTT